MAGPFEHFSGGYFMKSRAWRKEMSRNLSIIIAILTCLHIGFFTGKCRAEELQYEESRMLVSLVDEAAALIAKKGEAAFKELSVEGSKWRHGDTYIIVNGLDGTCFVHPDPALVGKNQINLTDIDGKPIVKEFIAKVKGNPQKQSGWSHYQWVKQGDITPCWKTTYVKLVTAPSGKEYIVASGLYCMKMEKAFVVESVNSAAVLLEKEGRAAFSTLRDKKSEYNYKDTYVFIIDEKGTLLLDPPFPALEGRNVYDYKDPSGKYLFREMIDMANSQGSGWVEYMWPKPDTMEYEKKGSFIKKVKVGNEVLIVGTGMYLEGYRSCTIYSIP